MKRGLVVVDVQVDFCEGGALPVVGGAEVAEAIDAFIRVHRDRYDLIVASKDWHLAFDGNGGHFSDTPNFKTTWPPHCVMGTAGAAFHPNLDPQLFDHVVAKGPGKAAYSAFQGATLSGLMLDSLLLEEGINDIDIVGIATEYCVKQTALDADALDYRAGVILDLTAAVGGGIAKSQAADEMAAQGVWIRERVR